MSEPLISTIIPVYNRAAMLVDCVTSVLHQDYPHIEIIIVDDGSTDNTLEIANQLAAQHPQHVIVLHQTNAGPGLARDQYLDSDDRLLANKFSDQISAWHQNTNADIIYGITQRVDENGKIIASPSKQTGQQFDSFFPRLLIDRWWHTSTPIYSKRISDLAGPWLDFRPEDWDLEARMGAHKPLLVSTNTLVSSHVDHSEQGRVSQGNHERYLLDEAKFLPRLYDCAQQAGVVKGSAEMRHFSKWVLMRSRHLAAIGEVNLAEQLFQLSCESSSSRRLIHNLIAILRRIIGWKFTGRLSLVVERLL